MVHVLKVYLYSSSRGKYEIRRIAATSEAIYSYSMLCQKINTLFPSLNGKTFELSWKDEEGDDILMSTDEELAQAIANLEDSLVRIYVHLTDENVQIPDVSSGRQEIHPHIVCDACNGKVQGYRYKCLQCDDYDLCNSCHAQDKHPDHDMLKLASPSNVAHSWIFPGWRRLWQSMFGHFPIPTDKFAAGHRRCGSSMPGACHKDKGSPHSRPKCPWKSSRKHRAEYVKNIGQTVANLLNPFGFDITVDVVQSDSDQELSSPKGEANQEFDVEMDVQKEAEKQNEEVTHAAENSCKPSEPEAPKVVEQNVISSESTSHTEADSSKPPLGARPKTKSPSPSDESAPSKEATPERLTGLFATVEEAVKTLADDWTMINSVAADCEKDKEICNKVSEAVSAVAQSIISPEVKSNDKSTTPAEEKKEAPLHHDPKIAAALQNMFAMGFTNEGGWLLRLLETKNGNICEALDALYRR